MGKLCLFSSHVLFCRIRVVPFTASTIVGITIITYQKWYSSNRKNVKTHSFPFIILWELLGILSFPREGNPTLKGSCVFLLCNTIDWAYQLQSSTVFPRMTMLPWSQTNHTMISSVLLSKQQGAPWVGPPRPPNALCFHRQIRSLLRKKKSYLSCKWATPSRAKMCLIFVLA